MKSCASLLAAGRGLCATAVTAVGLASGLLLASKPTLAASLQVPPERSALAEPASPRFAILEFEISGNTVLPVAAVEQVVLPFMGEDKDMADVEAAREALEKRYQQAGFLTVFVDIPEQRVEGGVLRLHVTEGRVERLRVTGSRYYDQGVIRERVSQLAPGQVPDFNQAAAQIAGLNREERQLQQILRPGLTPGTVEVELRVNDKLPAGASLEINNRHAADTDPWRASLALHHDNLWQRDHSLTLSLITAPRNTKQSSVLVGNYSWPLSAEPGRPQSLLATVVLSNSNVAPLGAGTVIGKGATYGLRWNRSVPHASSEGDSLHSFSVGGDYKDVQEQQLSAGSELSTPLRYLPFQAAYTGIWFAGGVQSSLSSSITFGWRNWLQRDVACPGNVGAVDQFQCKRDGADGSFAYWRGELRDVRPLRTLGLPAPLGGSLNTRFAWQLATQPLVSGEQYALGGVDTVRGYLEAEAAGDNAMLAGLEWRSPNLLAAPVVAGTAAKAQASWWRELTLLGYAEGGRVQTLSPLPEQTEHTWLAGAGLGLRLRAGAGLSADLDLAWPLKSTRISPKNEPRLHLRLSAQL